MAELRIHGVSENTKRQAKAAAALAGLPLEKWVIAAVEAALAKRKAS